MQVQNGHLPCRLKSFYTSWLMSYMLRRNSTQFHAVLAYFPNMWLLMKKNKKPMIYMFTTGLALQYLRNTLIINSVSSHNPQTLKTDLRIPKKQSNNISKYLFFQDNSGIAYQMRQCSQLLPLFLKTVYNGLWNSPVDWW